MDTATIDKRIADYELKLQKKIFRIKRGKLIRTGIPGHTANYIKKEIAKLKKEKEFLLNQKEYRVVVSWSKICFENNQIRLLINNRFTEPFQVSDSRSSYEFLKPYILRATLEPISVSVVGNKITTINNLEQLNTVLQILLIKDSINSYFDDFESTNIASVLSKLSKISNQYLTNFFKLKERNIYIHFLCNIHSDDYKIIPTTELILNNGKSISEEETFLFTVNSHNFIFIIWESTAINRATYVFKTYNERYIEDVQNLFDFIASRQNSKRRKLRYLSHTTNNPFKTVAVLDHKNSDLWGAKIQELLNI